MTDPRGTRHYQNQRPYCPRCHGSSVKITGPIQLVKGIEKAPCKCGSCAHTWKSENRGIILKAPAAAK